MNNLWNFDAHNPLRRALKLNVKQTELRKNPSFLLTAYSFAMAMLPLYIYIMLLSYHNSLSDNLNNLTHFDFIDRINDIYQIHSLPPNIGNEARIVNLTVAIRSIFDISEMESSLTVQYTMLVEWYDERLKFKPFMENNKLKDSITLNGNLLKDKGEHF